MNKCKYSICGRPNFLLPSGGTCIGHPLSQADPYSQITGHILTYVAGGFVQAGSKVLAAEPPQQVASSSFLSRLRRSL